MDRFMERIQQRLQQRQRSQAAPKAKTRQNMTFNRFDRRMWDEIRESDTTEHNITDLMVGDKHRGGERDGYDNAPELLQDLTYALYKPDPKLVDERAVVKDARLNRAIIEEVQRSPYYDELREHTVLDDTCTAIALETMADALREILARNQEAAQQSNQDKAEQEEEMNNEDNRPPGCHPQPKPKPDEPGDEPEGESEGGEPGGESEGGEPGGEPGGEGGEPGGEGGESGGEGGEGGGKIEFDDDPELGEGEHEGEYDLDDDLARAVNQAMREATDEVDELQGLRRGIGLEDGEWRQMSPAERIAMAGRLNTPEMKQIADMVGRMKRFAMGQQATKIADVPHAPVGVEQGNDLRHLLASEYALLDDPETEWMFYQRYLDKELLQYKLQGTEKAGKGPIVACIDKSYSMNGRPFAWAMGVAEALRRICQTQQRDYFATFFGSNNDHHDFDFPKGQADFARVMEFLSCDANGGTQFDGVLEKALARISAQHDEGLGRADIVFITDGQAHLSDEWLKSFNEERERVGCRIFGVYIGGARDMYSNSGAATGVLQQFSDFIIPISDLSVESVRDIFARV